MLASPQSAHSRPLTVALVNNMPDAAFLDTEAQFVSALTRVSPADRPRIELYAMAGIVRSDAIASQIRSRYRGLEDLWDNPPDALVLTGTEPVQAQLAYEPYWADLSQLLHWASSAVPTTLLSCLAAHASLLLFDGIERRPLPTKCSGIFPASVTEQAATTFGIRGPALVPHSRVNDVPESALQAAGYSIIIGGTPAAPGWSVASRHQGDGLFVLCQGHPEYSTESLLREYRRDVRRYLFGRGAAPYPAAPTGYFNQDAEALLTTFAQSARQADPADPGTVYDAFPYDAVLTTLTNSWSDTATGVYSGWLALATARASAHPSRTRTD